MVDKFVLPDIPDEPAVTPEQAKSTFVLPQTEEERAIAAAQPKRTNTTFMDTWDIYNEMRQEEQNRIGKGIGQLKEGYSQVGTDKEAGNMAYGAGNVLLGTLGYVTSPINAAYRAVVGEPIEQRTGIPKGYTEFAAQLATPGLGLKSIGQPLTPVTKTVAPRVGPLADEARLYTKEGQEIQAGLALKEAAKRGRETPEQVRAKLADTEELISEPTTFQAAPNYGLGQLERGVGTTSEGQAALQAKRAEQSVARMGVLERDVIRPGNPEEVANELRASMATEDAAAEAAEKVALARAQQADQAAGGTGFTPDISGQVFQRELAEANTTSRNNAKTLWDNIDPQGRLSVNADPVINAELRIRSNMALADAETVTDAERRIAKVIGQYPPVVSFKEMRALRSLISGSMREEMRARGPSAAYARMADLRGAVEQSAVAPFEAGVAAGPGQAAMSVDAAERLAAATAATKERSAIFKSEPVQSILKPGQGGEFKTTPSVVPEKIIPNGPRGYDTVNAYLRATEGRPGGGLQEVSQALVADMRASATDVNGNLDPGKLMGWARRKQDALRAVTERDNGALVQRLREVQITGLEAKTAGEAVAAVSKKGNEGIFGALMGVRDREDVSKLLGGVFGSKTAVADARAIMARMTTPEAQDGARRAVADWLTNKLVSNTSAGITDVNLLRADQFQSFIRQNVAPLRAFGFTPEQIRTMQLISEDMRRSKLSVDATKVPGGSNTAQDLYAMKKFGLQVTHLPKLLLPIGWLHNRGIKSVRELIVEGMVDPAVGHRLLGKTLPQENIAFWKTLGKFGGRTARTGVLMGKPHFDQDARLGKEDIPFKRGGLVPFADGGGVYAEGGDVTRRSARLKQAPRELPDSSALLLSQAPIDRKYEHLPASQNIEDRRGESWGIGEIAGFTPDEWGTMLRRPMTPIQESLPRYRRLEVTPYQPGGLEDQAGRGSIGRADGGDVFDPEGSDYDMKSAVAAGFGPDETGHWPSRVPDTGLILKGRGHKSYYLTEEGERAAGYEISKGEGGRYYSQPKIR